MATCPNGHENPENNNYCGECGVALGTTASPRPATARRPWTVTAAAVIAFLYALPLAAEVVYCAVEGVRAIGKHHLPLYETSSYLLIRGLGFLVMVLLLVWGAVAALRGVTRKVLFFVPVAWIVFSIVLVAITVSEEHGRTASVDIWWWVTTLILALPIVFLVTRSSRDFFRARAGTPAESVSPAAPK